MNGKTILKMVGVMICVLLSNEVLTKAFSLMSEADDIAVYAGTAVVIAIAAAWAYAILWVMKRKKYIAQFAVLSLLAISASACTTIAPGHVGIKVNSYGANKGVSDFPAVTGFVTYNPWSVDIIEYPVFVQNAVWTKSPTEGNAANEEISFNNADSMTVFADIALSYQLDASKAPAFYVKFRADDINTWTHGFLRNTTRQRFDEIAGKYHIETIMGDNAEFLRTVKAAVQEDVKEYGITIGSFGFIGSPRPPKSVTDSIEMKVKATQDAMAVENQVRQTKAQAEKDVAKAQGEAAAAIARAEGEAKANAIVNQSITANLLEWRKLEMQNYATGRWDGKLPQYNAGQLPFITIPGGK